MLSFFASSANNKNCLLLTQFVNKRECVLMNTNLYGGIFRIQFVESLVFFLSYYEFDIDYCMSKALNVNVDYTF